MDDDQRANAKCRTYCASDSWPFINTHIRSQTIVCSHWPTVDGRHPPSVRWALLLNWMCTNFAFQRSHTRFLLTEKRIPWKSSLFHSGPLMASGSWYFVAYSLDPVRSDISTERLAPNHLSLLILSFIMREFRVDDIRIWSIQLFIVSRHHTAWFRLLSLESMELSLPVIIWRLTMHPSFLSCIVFPLELQRMAHVTTQPNTHTRKRSVRLNLHIA